MTMSISVLGLRWLAGDAGGRSRRRDIGSCRDHPAFDVVDELIRRPKEKPDRWASLGKTPDEFNPGSAGRAAMSLRPFVSLSHVRARLRCGRSRPPRKES